MGSELRQLTFNMDEVRTFVTRQLSSKEPGRPSGTVMDLKVIRATPLLMQAHIQTFEGTQVKTTLDEPQLTASIIEYCMEAKIPLPRKSQKNLVLTGSGFVLEIYVAKL